MFYLLTYLLTYYNCKPNYVAVLTAGIHCYKALEFTFDYGTVAHFVIVGKLCAS